MEKIKDFIYDKNDILVALLVLVFAAFLIWWRMDVIMAYPETVFSEGEAVESPVQDEEPSDVEGSVSGNEGGEEEGEGDVQGGNEGGDEPAVPTSGLWEGGVLTRDVEVDVYGNSAMSAVQCLVDAGLFDDYNEYKTICDIAGMNHETVSAGSLVFTAGTTKEEVARKINWS